MSIDNIFIANISINYTSLTTAVSLLKTSLFPTSPLTTSVIEAASLLETFLLTTSSLKTHSLITSLTAISLLTKSFQQLAVKHILANKSAIRNEDCLADYHYEGSDRWSSKERLKFREALDKYGKKFHEIAKEVWGLDLITKDVLSYGF